MNSPRPPMRDKRIKTLLPLLSLLLLLPPLFLHYQKNFRALPQPRRLQGFLDSQRERESLQNTDVSSRSLLSPSVGTPPFLRDSTGPPSVSPSPPHPAGESSCWRSPL